MTHLEYVTHLVRLSVSERPFMRYARGEPSRERRRRSSAEIRRLIAIVRNARRTASETP